MKKASFLFLAALCCTLLFLSCSSGGGGGTSKTYKNVTDYSSFTGDCRNIVCAGEGVLYLTSGNNKIYKIDADGVSSVFSENTAPNDPYSIPIGITIDGAGNLYVGNDLNYNIIRITPAGAAAVFIGDTGNSGSSNTPPVRFNRPYGVAYNTDDSILYVGDSMNSKIRKVDCANSNATTDFAAFGFVYSVKLDAEGNVYAASGVNNIIKKFAPAGTDLATYTIDSTVEPALYDFAIASNGTIYAVDDSNLVIWKVDTAGTVTLFAGVVGSTGHDNGPLLSASFEDIRGIAVDTDGTIYIADSGNNCIRKIALE
jgi:serine/threonine protein kinase, bacterial